MVNPDVAAVIFYCHCRICAEHLTEKAEHQAVAVLGIALTALGEDVGTDMCLRTFEHLLQYGELPVRRVVPLALALLHISNPDYSIIDQLSRLSHDQDAALSQCAILGLGLICAGSNNSRVAGLLRQLAEFYAQQGDHLFVVRLAQGLNAMGKGLINLTPFTSDR
jgi:26S proteasome regulatory subunit N1